MRNLLLAGTIVALSASGAHAQANVEGRVGKLESEMRAVQRKVFPTGQYVQPEITAPETVAGPGPGTPATSAIADLSGRVTALEQQFSAMTGQIEQDGYRIRQLQDAFDAYRKTADARVKALENAGENASPPSAAVGGGSDEIGPVTPPRGGTKPVVAPRPGTAAPIGAGVGPDAARAERIAAVAKPASGDGAEDGYLYGYRLWQAKLYPEAEVELKKVVATYPKSRRASYSQNLLGRAYLDDGKPSLASMAFYDNYKKMPDGERAPDSLLYLGQALVKLNKPADACKVYDELGEVYAARITDAMKADIAAGRATAKCK